MLLHIDSAHEKKDIELSRLQGAGCVALCSQEEDLGNQLLVKIMRLLLPDFVLINVLKV